MSNHRSHECNTTAQHVDKCSAISACIPITMFTTTQYVSRDTLNQTHVHAYLLNSACFSEEIMLEAPGTMFFSSYSFSFFFNCRICKIQQKMYITVQNEPLIMVTRLIRFCGFFFHFKIKYCVVGCFILPLAVASHI